MIIYEKGDVVLIPFSFSDLLSEKKRSTVIISSSKFNKTTQNVIVMAITSNIRKDIASINNAIKGLLDITNSF